MSGRYDSLDRIHLNSKYVSNHSTVDLADGGVYTFLSTDYVTEDYGVEIVQRNDIIYTPAYQTYYTIDQAEMGKEWQMKLIGDTDNVPYQISIWGPESPPTLGSVSYDASNPAATKVSWQLTSDVRPPSGRRPSAPPSMRTQTRSTSSGAPANTPMWTTIGFSGATRRSARRR